MEESRLSLPLDQRKKPIELAIRKFIFGSFRVFDDVGKRSVGLQDDRMDLRTHASAMRAMLYRFSRLFREQLSTLLIDIDQIETTFFGQNNLGMESLQPEYDLTAYLVTTWHLCEIFLLNQSNSSSLEAVVWLKVGDKMQLEKLHFEYYRISRITSNGYHCHTISDLMSCMNYNTLRADEWGTTD